MPYFFRCDGCFMEEEVSFDRSGLERSCAECGMDGCYLCIYDEYGSGSHPVCDQCRMKVDNDEDED